MGALTGENYKTKIKGRLITASDDNLCIWGPWFALLLVRLEKRSSDHFITKLGTLNSNLTKLYTISKWEPLSLDSTSDLKSFLEGYNGLNLNDNLKFTLYNALIKKYNDSSSTHMERGMLNFTTLQSLRYNGLNLLTLVDQIKKIYNVTVSQLIEPLGTAETVVSWKQYMRFSKAMMIETNKDKRWMFAREFDPSVFVNMSYNDNNLLCNLAAAMIDHTKSAGETLSENNPGPTYSEIISLRQNAKTLGALGFHIARKAHEHLSLQYSYRGINPVTTEIIKSYNPRKGVECKKRMTDEEY